MNKAIIFLAGCGLGGAFGFLGGMMMYKKKLAKAERDIDVLLKEINTPKEDSEVADDEKDGGDKEGDAEEAVVAGAVAGEKKEQQRREHSWRPGSGRQHYSYRDSGDADAISYEEFYKRIEGDGRPKVQMESGGQGVETGNYISDPRPDPAELESPTEEDFDDDSDDHGHSDEEEGESPETTRMIIPGKKPKVISGDSFYNEYPAHDKRELEYYAGDDVLVDSETEEEVDDEDRLVGDCLNKFGFRYNDEEFVIYVRNFEYGVDYEISKTFKSFYDD